MVRLPGTNETGVGALGTVAVTIASLVAGVELPTALIATTSTTYDVPLTKPLIVHVVGGMFTLTAVEQLTLVPFASVAVVRYPVTVVPPLSNGAVQETSSWPMPEFTTTCLGMPGVVAGVPETSGPENDPVPTALVAATRNW
jgi:hypothetical protein